MKSKTNKFNTFYKLFQIHIRTIYKNISLATLVHSKVARLYTICRIFKWSKQTLPTAKNNKKYKIKKKSSSCTIIVIHTHPILVHLKHLKQKRQSSASNRCCRHCCNRNNARNLINRKKAT